MLNIEIKPEKSFYIRGKAEVEVKVMEINQTAGLTCFRINALWANVGHLPEAKAQYPIPPERDTRVFVLIETGVGQQIDIRGVATYMKVYDIRDTLPQGLRACLGIRAPRNVDILSEERYNRKGFR